MIATDNLQIVPFEAHLSPTFYDINREWIASMFTLEQVDIDMLRRPREKILANGGHIWFAKHPKLGVIGTCALLHHGEGVFELTKMGVLHQARGLNAGHRLLAHAIKQAHRMLVREMFLLTNKRCEAAIYLYEKHGFVHDAGTMQRFGGSYKRCDVAMRYADFPG